MNKKILNTGVQNFINENTDTDIVSVLLKKSIFEGVSQRELAQQIEGKKKCQKKLPTWFEARGIYYPKKINIEQTSSEITAAYKAEIVEGKSLVDLTGGLGIDSYYFAQKITAVFYCEVSIDLHQIAAHNFKILKADNVRSYAQDGLHFLKNSKQKYDWLYLDPSRRNESKGKVFRLSDCQPNVLENMDRLFDSSDNILLKTSPLLDISMSLKDLSGVKEVHIVAIDNEVKELLWVLKKGYTKEAGIQTRNIAKSKTQSYDFTLYEEKTAISEYGMPLSHLYEPNTAILKSGAFKSIGAKHRVKKLHTHTHLYTSNELLNFPGRRFKILKTVAYNTKGIKELNISKANISTRNFPDSVAFIRKKFKIKDGGSAFLFFFKNCADKYQVTLCQKA